MSFNAIRENKILAKISGLTVLNTITSVLCTQAKCIFVSKREEFIESIYHYSYMDTVARKPAFGGLRIAKVQTSLRIRSV